MMKAWKDIYNICNNAWTGGLPETNCGCGSTLKNSIMIIGRLNEIIRNYNITSIADVGCGDFNWMRKIDLSNILYTGYDWILTDSLDGYKSKNISFVEGNIAEISIKKADLIICKDVMIHMDNDHALSILSNIKKSKAKYLLITTFNIDSNIRDLDSSNFAPLNIELRPFYLMNLMYSISLAMPDYPPNDNKYFNLYRL